MLVIGREVVIDILVGLLQIHWVRSLSGGGLSAVVDDHA